MKVYVRTLEICPEIIRRLLAEGSESYNFDYKTRVDLDDELDTLELSKHIAAMQVHGRASRREYPLVRPGSWGRIRGLVQGTNSVRASAEGMRDIVSRGPHLTLRAQWSPPHGDSHSATPRWIHGH